MRRFNTMMICAMVALLLPLLSACGAVEKAFNLGDGALEDPANKFAATKIIYAEALTTLDDLYEEGHVSDDRFLHIGTLTAAADVAIAAVPLVDGLADASFPDKINRAISLMMDVVSAVERVKLRSNRAALDPMDQRIIYARYTIPRRDYLDRIYRPLIVTAV